MRVDVDKSGVQFAEFFNIGKQPLSACPLQWGQHFERKLVFVAVLCYEVCYGHNRMQSYLFFQ
jgi:hypothetical protein